MPSRGSAQVRASHTVVRLLICFYRWLEACIGVELPPASEMENELLNGIIIGKLAHFFAPKVVQVRHIYDYDETIYKVCLLDAGHVHTPHTRCRRKALCSAIPTTSLNGCGLWRPSSFPLYECYGLEGSA